MPQLQNGLMKEKVSDLICLLQPRYVLISLWLFGTIQNIYLDFLFYFQLPHVGNRASDVDKFLEIQLNRLQTPYVDLYLIHVPFGFICDHKTLTPKVDDDGNYELDMNTDHIETWKVGYQIMRLIKECE